MRISYAGEGDKYLFVIRSSRSWTKNSDNKKIKKKEEKFHVLIAVTIFEKGPVCDALQSISRKIG